jgi:hypothetical protein
VTDVGDARPGPERQLLGVRERVAIYHGEVVAEPVDEAGYAVRARLPVERRVNVHRYSPRTVDIALTVAVLIAAVTEALTRWFEGRAG